MSDKSEAAHSLFSPSVKMGVLLFAGLSLIGILGYVAITIQSAPSPKSVSTPMSASSAPQVLANQPKPVTMIVAQRQGRCKALEFHLSRLSKSVEPSTAETALKALGLLAGEMMNGYGGSAANAVQDPGSRASLKVFTPEGQRGLHEAREALRTQIRMARDMPVQQAADSIAQRCAACHANYVRDTHKLSMLGGTRAAP